MNNEIIMRPYNLSADFFAVRQFLTETYTLPEINGMMIPQFFEYAYMHPGFNHDVSDKMTVWEQGGKIIAFCGYEMDLGEAYLVAGKNYEHLLPELLSRAEATLAADRELGVWATDKQKELTKLLLKNGYKNEASIPVKIFRYENEFQKPTLPEGFKCVNLEKDVDLRKLNRCIWRGFDHGDDVVYDLDGISRPSEAPNYRADLGRIIVAPDGEYACYMGMWLDEKNSYAYLEPLCTQPEYRRMGLAKFALTDSMRQTKSLGAKYCFGGEDDFYTALGFEVIANRQMFTKSY